MGLLSRRKGRAFEQEIARRFREMWPTMEVFRGAQGAGAREADVAHDYAWVECKCGKRIGIEDAVSQAIRDAVGSGKVPVVVHKRDRGQVYVTMLLDDWMLMVDAILREGK